MSIINSIVFLPVSDIEKTDRFYTEAVGLIKHAEQSGGICRIYDTGYGYIGFCQYPDGRPALSGPQGVCLSFNCSDEEDVRRQYERISAMGLPTWNAPEYHKDFPVYSFYLPDPDGYKVEFQVLLNDRDLSPFC